MLNLFQSAVILFSIFSSIWIGIKIYYKKKNITNNEYKKIFIAITFILFGILKLYNLEKFSEIFSKYDIIAKYYKSYAYLYPFIEIIIGILILNKISLSNIFSYINILMIISILSVIISMSKGQNLRCGCLGSFFHIPLSYVTLSENILMLLMSYSIKN